MDAFGELHLSSCAGLGWAGLGLHSRHLLPLLGCQERKLGPRMPGVWVYILGIPAGAGGASDGIKDGAAGEGGPPNDAQIGVYMEFWVGGQSGLPVFWTGRLELKWSLNGV